ncbi:MAG: hypothetical protein QOE70_3985 [Chthoniobacter sp.]|jgi:hypothetical protein|nr:hypothetical protein [Chthoniobacter sp.]
MNARRYGLFVVAIILLIVAVTGLFWHGVSKQGSSQNAPHDKVNAVSQAGIGSPRPGEGERASRQNGPAFPENDVIELPFLGKVSCHSRPETVSFTATGTKLDWPFKVFFLPNGMFVRAEFVKPGAKDYEASRADIEELYRAGAESLTGFPEKAAPANLSKVLQSLYENEPFDRATKINITWVLRKGTNGKVQPCFIANIFGVSPGLMRVPNDDEGFLKYRILLTPEGEAVRTDNFL